MFCFCYWRGDSIPICVESKVFFGLEIGGFTVLDDSKCAVGWKRQLSLCSLTHN